jgi:hypothetical protein
LLSGINSSTPTSIERFAFWVTGNAIAVAIAASQNYVPFGEGFPRLIVDGLVVGLLQGLALQGLVRLRYWTALTLAALGLALVAGIATVAAAGLLMASIDASNSQLYLVLIYGLGAVVAGFVGGFTQSGALPAHRRLLPWLLGTAGGAPFVFPALLFSWVSSGSATAPLPAWAVGMLGGLVYGVVSAIGLRRSLRPISPIA